MNRRPAAHMAASARRRYGDDAVQVVRLRLADLHEVARCADDARRPNIHRRIARVRRALAMLEGSR
ncbi:MAG: hypothetical protein JSR26_02655 [Proteobacteria bacterium]|nr:hypothetical protein [Pseudomonadota bacterium]